MIAVLAVVMMMMRIMRMSNNWITQRCCNCGLFLLVGCSHPFYQPSFHLAPRQIDNPDHDDDLAPWCVLVVMLDPSIRKIGWKISILWCDCVYILYLEFLYLCLRAVFMYFCLRVEGCKFRNQWCSSYWGAVDAVDLLTAWIFWLPPPPTAPWLLSTNTNTKHKY